MYKSLLPLSFAFVLSGCSLFSVYKIDIPQGTPLTQAQVSKLAVGMSRDQVFYLLGSPAVVDPMANVTNANGHTQWDYIYDFTPGTYAKQEKIPASHKEQILSVIFDANGTVINIVGLENIPAKQSVIPSALNKVNR